MFKSLILDTVSQGFNNNSEEGYLFDEFEIRPLK